MTPYRRDNFYRRELASLERKHAASLDTIHTALTEGSARMRVAIERLARTLENEES